MFGFAVDETEELMPLPNLTQPKLSVVWLNFVSLEEISHLRPDAKSQVTVEYDENDQPVRQYDAISQLSMIQK